MIISDEMKLRSSTPKPTLRIVQVLALLLQDISLDVDSRLLCPYGEVFAPLSSFHGLS